MQWDSIALPPATVLMDYFVETKHVGEFQVYRATRKLDKVISDTEMDRIKEFLWMDHRCNTVSV
jgi:hypothetical protein